MVMALLIVPISLRCIDSDQNTAIVKHCLKPTIGEDSNSVTGLVVVDNSSVFFERHDTLIN